QAAAAGVDPPGRVKPQPAPRGSAVPARRMQAAGDAADYRQEIPEQPLGSRRVRIEPYRNEEGIGNRAVMPDGPAAAGFRPGYFQEFADPVMHGAERFTQLGGRPFDGVAAAPERVEEVAVPG